MEKSTPDLSCVESKQLDLENASSHLPKTATVNEGCIASAANPNAVIGDEAAALLNLLLERIDARAQPITASSSVPLAALERIRNDWLFEMRHQQQLSARTIESYTWSASALAKHLACEKSLACGEDELRAFFDYLDSPAAASSGGGYARQPGQRSRALHHANLRAMLNWAVKKGYLLRSPMEGVPAPRYKAKKVLPFRDSDVVALLASAKKTDNGPRDFAILMLMFDCGLRAQETCDLLLSDVDFAERTITVRHGKGDKERIVVFSPDTLTALWNYLRDAPRRPSDPLFRSQRGSGAGGALTRSGLRHLFKRLEIAAGIEGVRCSPHTMRHAFASSYIMGGGAVEDLQKLMGHTTPAMSMRYVELNKEHLKQQPHEAQSGESIVEAKEIS